ncbi:uncharacterized protein AC631_00900 [Debaryomyces fabryi]|uniref:Major facilitator superfamily (MFS) profile domain-containing protein n=1 Tax=Debaryomyces fabryi TaxID=58627 RepID=A0A0V1Q4L7_9ASCO|nr:uncharacterized protein AC631_00900 [Debaryomyces fabryi]KSA03415.1 hypothetical protein AC631_00900 [Debaryomyces fabryi]CUM50056.1 unnamed protein product [Debaryomyces fabryi]
MSIDIKNTAAEQLTTEENSEKDIYSVTGSNKDGVSYNDIPWYKVPHLRQLNFCVLLISLSSATLGYDSSMLNGLQSLAYWRDYLGNPTGTTLGALTNGTIFGFIIGNTIAPYVADKFGRRIAIISGQIIIIIGSVLQGVSTNYAFFLVSRVILGFGSILTMVSSPSLISEISYPTHRHVTTTFYNTNYYVGAAIAAWVTFGTSTIASNYSWRIPSYLQGAIALIQISLFWMVPESPRYYISKGKVDKAQEVLMKNHIGNSQDPGDIGLVKFEVEEIQAALEMEKISANTSYIDFLRTPANRKRLFICIFIAILMQLSGNGLVSFYLSKVLNSIGISDEKEQLKINGCLMIYNWATAVAVSFFVNRFRRRTLFMTSTILMLLTYVIWTVLSAINEQRDFKEASLGKGVLAMIFFYYLGYNMGANGLPYLYLTEILPYNQRAKGINLMMFFYNIILIYNGFVNPVAMDAISWKYYIVYCCVIVFEIVVVYLFLPETSGYTLEEVCQVFGDNPQMVAIPKAHIPKVTTEHIDVV